MMVFLVNGLDHVYFAWMLSGKYPGNSQLKAFGVLGIGTTLDSFLSAYARGKREDKDKKEKNWFIDSIRFVLLLGTMIGQTMCLREEMLPMITGNQS